MLVKKSEQLLLSFTRFPVAFAFYLADPDLRETKCRPSPQYWQRNRHPSPDIAAMHSTNRTCFQFSGSSVY